MQEKGLLLGSVGTHRFTAHLPDVRMEMRPGTKRKNKWLPKAGQVEDKWAKM